MSNILVNVEAGSLGNPCYRTEQERYLDFLLKTVWSVRLGDTAGVLIQESAPGPDDYDKVWLKLGTDGNLEWPGLPFIWNALLSQWTAPHPKPPGSPALEIWIGAAADIDTYDGGEVAGITATTGPMWAIVAAFEDRVPAGVKAAGIIAAVNTDYDTIEIPGAPTANIQARGVYFIQRTAREFYRR